MISTVLFLWFFAVLSHFFPTIYFLCWLHNVSFHFFRSCLHGFCEYPHLFFSFCFTFFLTLSGRRSCLLFHRPCGETGIRKAIGIGIWGPGWKNGVVKGLFFRFSFLFSLFCFFNMGMVYGSFEGDIRHGFSYFFFSCLLLLGLIILMLLTL